MYKLYRVDGDTHHFCGELRTMAEVMRFVGIEKWEVWYTDGRPNHIYDDGRLAYVIHTK
jgi:hypothetical protein